MTPSASLRSLAPRHPRPLRPVVLGALAALALAGCTDAADVGDDLDAGADIGTTAAALTRDQLWSQVKSLESSVTPTPPATETIDIGTFYAGSPCDPRANAASPCFPGGSKWHTELVNGRPQYFQTPKDVAARGTQVFLRFKLVGASSMTVTVNGATQTGSTVVIPAGVAYGGSLVMQIKAGTRVYKDMMTLRRVPEFGVGGFTIPVLPIGIIYEPPQPPSRWALNTATYTTSTTVGAAIGWRRSTETAETTFEPPDTLGNTVGAIAAAYTAAGGAGYVGSALSALASGLGSATGSQTLALRSYREHRLNVSSTYTTSRTTNSGTGPGDGDLLVYLENARVVWVWNGTRIQLTVLDAAREVTTSPGSLRRYEPGLNNDTPRGAGLRALLALDPFATGGPNAGLPSARFVAHTPLGAQTGVQTHTASHTVTTSDLSGTGVATIEIENHSAGWMAKLGIGEQRTYGRRVALDYSKSREVMSSTTTTASFTLNARQGESYTVQVFYDRIFNSFALRMPGTGCTPLTCN